LESPSIDLTRANSRWRLLFRLPKTISLADQRSEKFERKGVAGASAVISELAVMTDVG
jgi:hypothetical protein